MEGLLVQVLLHQEIENRHVLIEGERAVHMRQLVATRHDMQRELNAVERNHADVLSHLTNAVQQLERKYDLYIAEHRR